VRQGKEEREGTSGSFQSIAKKCEPTITSITSVRVVPTTPVMFQVADKAERWRGGGTEKRRDHRE
jgi:hypothetical protein